MQGRGLFDVEERVAVNNSFTLTNIYIYIHDMQSKVEVYLM